jgi:hypothetical protein
MKIVAHVEVRGMWYDVEYWDGVPQQIWAHCLNGTRGLVWASTTRNAWQKWAEEVLAVAERSLNPLPM